MMRTLAGTPRTRSIVTVYESMSTLLDTFPLNEKYHVQLLGLSFNCGMESDASYKEHVGTRENFTCGNGRHNRRDRPA